MCQTFQVIVNLIFRQFCCYEYDFCCEECSTCCSESQANRGSIVSDPAFFFVSILVFIVLFLVEGLDMKGGWSRYGYFYFLALIALDGRCCAV